MQVVIHRKLPEPIMLFKNDEDNKYYPRIGVGYNTYIIPSDFKEVLADLQDYVSNYSDAEITEINDYLIAHHFDMPLFSSGRRTKPINNRNSGYVYVMSCADRFKIGYSKDVEKRRRQLDTRPFELKIEYTLYNDNAYKIEQSVHEYFQDSKVANEWYANISLPEIIEAIEHFAEVI